MKIPNWGQWHEYGSEIRGHIEHPKDCRYQPGIETKARNFHVPLIKTSKLAFPTQEISESRDDSGEQTLPEHVSKLKAEVG